VGPIAWIAVGAGVLLLVAVIVAIAAYPRDNSF
jgi:hypothetical protein